MSKMWSDFDVLVHCQNIPIFLHVLDVLSGQGDRIELIFFALFQASPDTSLEYPQHIILRTLKLHFFSVDTPMWDP